MPTYSPGDPCWMDLMTDSMEATRAFYGALFGWTFEDAGADFGHYNTMFLNGVPVAGAMQNADAAAGMPEDMTDTALGNYWTAYLSTDDIHALAARAEAAGASVMYDPMRVGDSGWNTVVVHPALGAVGAWQKLDFAGIGEQMKPGTPYWFEGHSAAFDEAQTLLAEVFEWDNSMMADTPEFRYGQNRGGEEPTAGLYDSAETLGELPAHWQVYIGAEDIDAAVAKVVELGGTVLSEPQDSPWGRLAFVADSLGATLNLAQGMAEEE